MSLEPYQELGQKKCHYLSNSIDIPNSAPLDNTIGTIVLITKRTIVLVIKRTIVWIVYAKASTFLSVKTSSFKAVDAIVVIVIISAQQSIVNTRNNNNKIVEKVCNLKNKTCLPSKRFFFHLYTTKLKLRTVIFEF